MTRNLAPSLALLLLPLTPIHSRAADSQTPEIAAIHHWTEAKFGGRSEALPPQSHLVLHLRADALARKNLQGHAFSIAEQSFPDGIAMRSKGVIDIRVPSGASRFEAALGVDGNDIGYYSNTGRGSVVASVVSGGRELYRSPVLHEGLAPIALNVDLRGAKEFSIRLDAVGARGPTYQAEWDQADWANAKITLINGQTQLLSDLPIGPLQLEESTDPPFSFQLDKKPSSALLPNWQVERQQHRLDARRIEYTFLYRDGPSGLSVRGVAIAYDDSPSVEWTLYFKNHGSAPSALLENIHPLDIRLEHGSEPQIDVHHSRGSTSSATDFQPLVDTLTLGAHQHYSSKGGRPTDGDMPYFNLTWPGRGMIAALGWPGQWDLDISREQAESVHLTGGQSFTRFRLMPGEEVRTPLVVLQFWAGDWIDGQNVWRRWMIQHNLPRPGGQLPPPQLSAGSAHFTVEMQEADEANQRSFLLSMLDRHIPIDHWWMDAGWYKYADNWSHVGTWEIDPARFPRGLKPITNLGHQHGVKSILWFEPERVSEGTWLATYHPEWLIGPAGHDRLLYLGNQDAWHWLVDYISELIATQGIDVYRQDFNFEPLALWHGNDGPDRQGISEIRHVEGYLAFLDALRKRFPHLLLDTCASGGRRLDLETLRRAVPLWRSDYPYGAIPMQMQTYGLALWVPYFGTSANALDPYTFRSHMTPAVGIGPDPKLAGGRLAAELKLIAQWREVAGFYYGDFIPLTEYSADDKAWMAWQWSKTDGCAGIVQAFRREHSAFLSAVFPLRGLKRNATYTLEDLDSHNKLQLSGSELMDKGLPVTINHVPGAVLIEYRTGS